MKYIIQGIGGSNKMGNPSIDQYLVANCLYIIDEFNILYVEWDKQKLKKEADENFNEMDIIVRLGYPFKQNAHYTVGESNRVKKLQKVNHDLYISQRDFKIEVKYLKNWISSANTRAASKSWSVFQQDFDWLMDEIDADNYGKVAFVIGWFNCVDSFSQLIQLGKGSGAYPLVDERKKEYFPFLGTDRLPTYTKDLKINYNMAYKEQFVTPISTKYNGMYRCMFIGNEYDKFHFALYY